MKTTNNKPSINSIRNILVEEFTPFESLFYTSIIEQGDRLLIIFIANPRKFYYEPNQDIVFKDVSIPVEAFSDMDEYENRLRAFAKREIINAIECLVYLEYKLLDLANYKPAKTYKLRKSN